jgi:hypothetical protein
MESRPLINCTICLEDIIDDTDFLPCAHCFHHKCISQWLNMDPSQQKCPICKIPIHITSIEQLTAYNETRAQEEIYSEEEARYFHAISAGTYQNNNIQDDIQDDIQDEYNQDNDIYFNNNIISQLDESILAVFMTRRPPEQITPSDRLDMMLLIRHLYESGVDLNPSFNYTNNGINIISDNNIRNSDITLNDYNNDIIPDTPINNDIIPDTPINDIPDTPINDIIPDTPNNNITHDNDINHNDINITSNNITNIL